MVLRAQRQSNTARAGFARTASGESVVARPAASEKAPCRKTPESNVRERKRELIGQDSLSSGAKGRGQRSDKDLHPPPPAGIPSENPTPSKATLVSLASLVVSVIALIPNQIFKV
jgi:hypothetical protein